MGQTQEQAVSRGPVPLIPSRIKTGCQSVFPAGIKNKEFSIMSQFFKMNPTLKNFVIDLNITRCLESGMSYEM